MKHLLSVLALAAGLAATAHAAQLRNDAFSLSAARPSMSVQVTVPTADAKQGLRVEVFSNAPSQPLTVVARNPLGRERTASGNGRATLIVSPDDMVSRPGYPLTFRVEVRAASGFAPGAVAINGQLVVWSGADVRPPPVPMPQQVAPRPRPEPQAAAPGQSPLLKTLPPAGKP
jgi:hypothetical protein